MNEYEKRYEKIVAEKIAEGYSQGEAEAIAQFETYGDDVHRTETKGNP